MSPTVFVSGSHWFRKSLFTASTQKLVFCRRSSTEYSALKCLSTAETSGRSPVRNFPVSREKKLM